MRLSPIVPQTTNWIIKVFTGGQWHWITNDDIIIQKVDVAWNIRTKHNGCLKFVANDAQQYINMLKGIHECQIWADTNRDNVYGIVFGGYIKERSRDIDRGWESITYDLLGYAEFAQCNEYAAGYRWNYRCAYFNKTGLMGSCLVNSANFRKGGSSCYVGDWNTHHPDGLPVASTDHKCSDYATGTEILPYDTYTYDLNYAPSDDEHYEPYPKTLYDALLAACNMMNSLELGKSVSGYWDLATVKAWQPENTEDPVGVKEILQDVCIKQTIAATLENLADIATSVSVETEYVAWIDAYRQIQFTELNLDTAGADNTLRIVEDDIVEPPSFYLSGVVNRVCAQVNVSEDQWVYCEMKAEDIGIEGYENSVDLFGVCSEEVQCTNLNALTPTEGYTDFETFAKNYLKSRAFPRICQTIAVDAFVPDEHYYGDVDITDDTKKPYLVYTDDTLPYIDLLGTKVSAPDFWKPKKDFQSWYDNIFVIEGIRFVAESEGLQTFTTYLTLTRLTTPSEWA